MTAKFNIAGIGNALVDVIAHADDRFLDDNALTKGAMRLIEADEAEDLYGRMGPGIEMSGGSCANTMAGAAMLGSACAFFGKVRDDQLGRVFRHDIRAMGVTFESAPLHQEPPTGRSLILVTPDAQRTMNTFLGAANELTPDDIDPAIVEAAEIIYMEGYLWDRPTAKEAFLKAARIAHAAGRKVSLTLSDSFCVERHRDSFRDLIDGHVDVLFGNETEIMELYRVPTLEDAIAAVRGVCAITVITRSEKGSIVLEGATTHEASAERLGQVVDTTGAGDLYAAGFLHGLTAGRSLPDCARIGSIAAAEVISHVGARPEANLKALVARRMTSAA